MEYVCDKCKEKAKQLNLNREDKEFQCNKCFYAENNKKSSRRVK